MRRFGTFGNETSDNSAIFLQDSWAIGKNLTINLGVRAEAEAVPNYGHGQDPTLPAYFKKWDYADKVAPRFGFAWDVMGDQRLKVYGSYGTYYDIMKLEMPRGSFGGDRWIAYLYPLDTTNWSTLNAGCTIATNDPSINPCPALGIPVTRDLRQPTDPSDPVGGVDPDLQPMENREFQLGAEYQLNAVTVLGVRYVNKTLINTIEDVGFLRTGRQRALHHREPWQGRAALPGARRPARAADRGRARLPGARALHEPPLPGQLAAARQLHLLRADRQLLRSRQLRRVRPHRPERRPLLRRPGLRL